MPRLESLKEMKKPPMGYGEWRKLESVEEKISEIDKYFDWCREVNTFYPFNFYYIDYLFENRNQENSMELIDGARDVFFAMIKSIENQKKMGYIRDDDQRVNKIIEKIELLIGQSKVH